MDGHPGRNLFAEPLKKKLIKLKPMTRGDINDPNFPFDEWDQCEYDSWEMLKDPGDVTEEEIDFAKQFNKILNIDPDDECVIWFRAAPVHFYYLAVQILRRLKKSKF